MTEQDYDKLVNEAACKWCAENQFASHKDRGTSFKEAVAWARENPPPEVMDVLKALEYCSIEPGFLHPQNNSQQCAAVNALAIFKNRGK